MQKERKFDAEIDLVRSFTERYAKTFLKLVEGKPAKRFVLLEEFDCYNGVVDIVFAVFRPYARLDKTRPAINHNCLAPLAQLAKNSVIEVSQHAALCYASVTTARKQLEHFVRAGFLERLDKRHYRVSAEYSPVLESTISLEAKLHDWRRALVQAYRYRHFSNYSFVLLPTKTSTGALNNLELFRQHDVGLVTLGTNGLCIHHSPTRRERPLNAAFLRANEAAHSAYRC